MIRQIVLGFLVAKILGCSSPPQIKESQPLYESISFEQQCRWDYDADIVHIQRELERELRWCASEFPIGFHAYKRRNCKQNRCFKDFSYYDELINGYERCRREAEEKANKYFDETRQAHKCWDK